MYSDIQGGDDTTQLTGEHFGITDPQQSNRSILYYRDLLTEKNIPLMGSTPEYCCQQVQPCVTPDGDNIVSILTDNTCNQMEVGNILKEGTCTLGRLVCFLS